MAALEAGNWRCIDNQSHSASNGIHEIFNQLDLRLTKIFNLGCGGARFRTMFDLFNVFNVNAVTREQAGFGTTWLTPQVIMPGRLAKFAFQFDF